MIADKVTYQTTTECGCPISMTVDVGRDFIRLDPTHAFEFLQEKVRRWRVQAFAWHSENNHHQETSAHLGV